MPGQGNGKSKVGDVVAQDGQPGQGPGKGDGEPGEEPGEEYYEAEISLDELAAMIFEDLALPNLEEKRQAEMETETVRFTDIRKKGPMANLDKRRTIRENIRRNAAAGDPTFHDLNNDDLRFRTWEPTVRFESNAVVIAMMDVSGCHTRGHFIEMADGSYKDVSEIVVGDEVVCVDVEAMKKTTSYVVEIFSKTAEETLAITVEDADLRATPQHRYFVYDEPNNQIIEKRADQLQVGDTLILVNAWGSTSENHAANLTMDQAYMLGVLLGDGHISLSANSSYLTVTDESRERLEIYQQTFERAFGVRGIIHEPASSDDRRRIQFNRAPLARQLIATYPMLHERSRNRYIDASIYRESPEVRAAFLRGLFDAEGSIAHHSVMFFSASKKLITQVKHLLSYWGIRARMSSHDHDGERFGDGKPIMPITMYRLNINAKDVLLFAEHVGFACPQKQEKMIALVDKQRNDIDAMRSKYILENDWRERFVHIPRRTRLYTYYKSETHTLSHQQLRTLASSATATLEDQEYIDAVVKRRMVISKVEKIERVVEPVEVFDFGVETHHNYIVDGILSHNSMGDFEKYIARSFYFWMVRFLRTKYTNVKIVFISHHTEAKEVTEDEFFHRGESGGTQVSSAYELALDIIKQRFPARDWNIYPFHFSDGDNLPWDNERCVQLVEELMAQCNIFGYGEIREAHYRSPSTLMSAFGKIEDPQIRLRHDQRQARSVSGAAHVFQRARRRRAGRPVKAGDLMIDDEVQKLEANIGHAWDLALAMGLDPFPVNFEIVPASIMYEFGSYGLPGRFSHWTRGKAFYRMKLSYDLGLSKIYELVINTNPSYAFLLENNSVLENTFVAAHVFGHTDFFKHNAYFAHTARNMVDRVSASAERIRRYEFEHGQAGSGTLPGCRAGDRRTRGLQRAYQACLGSR